MRLVEKQRQHRFVGIAALGQLLEQLGQQPQQKGRVHLGRLVHQAAGIEQVDTPAPVCSRVQQVFELQGRLAEQRLGALLLKVARRRNNAWVEALVISALSSPSNCGLSFKWASNALRSFKSSSSRPSRSATLNAAYKAACWLSVSSSRLPSNNGPISLKVVRSGWPESPATSHRVTG